MLPKPFVMLIVSASSYGLNIVSKAAERSF